MHALSCPQELRQFSVYTTQTAREADAESRAKLTEAVRGLKCAGIKTNPWRPNHRQAHHF